MPTIGDRGAQHGEGDALLLRISTEMVRAQKRSFGKGPPQAKSYFLDDMLIVVMKGGLTTAEKTMLDFGEEDGVRAFRQAIDNEMTDRLAETIETLTGRKVVSHQSQVMFSPDRIIEMFVFGDHAAAAAELTDAAASRWSPRRSAPSAAATSSASSLHRTGHLGSASRRRSEGRRRRDT